VDGRAPAPRTFATVARSGSGTARTTFTYQTTRNQLDYRVRISGVAPSRVGGVVVMRAGAAGSIADTIVARPGAASTTPDSPRPSADSANARSGSARASHVVHRLSGPESVSATGTIHLDGLNLRALLDGRLEIVLITTDGATAGERVRLRMPSR